MESEQLTQILQEQQKKIDAIYTSVEKTRSYLWWTMIGTIAFFVLPLIGLLFIVPSFISTYSETITDLNL